MHLSIEAGTIKAPVAYEKYMDESFVKAAKAAAAPAKASGKPKNAAGEEEKDLNPNQYYEIRTRHINERMFLVPGEWCCFG